MVFRALDISAGRDRLTGGRLSQYPSAERDYFPKVLPQSILILVYKPLTALLCNKLKKIIKVVVVLAISLVFNLKSIIENLQAKKNTENCQYKLDSSISLISPGQNGRHIWTNANPVHWRIHATLGGDELRYCCYIHTCSIVASPLPWPINQNQNKNTFIVIKVQQSIR